MESGQSEVAKMIRIIKQKLYCYVDETGQDTEDKIFLVAVVVISKDRDILRKILQKIEKASEKKNRKWTKERRKRRKAYIRLILRAKELTGRIYYSHYTNTRAYIDLTILTTAKAVLDQAKHPYQAIVYVDGLRKNERNRFTAGLRKLHIKAQRARGLKDEADEFIRLADAIAGFIRDGIEGDDIMAPLYKKALRQGIVKEV